MKRRWLQGQVDNLLIQADHRPVWAVDLPLTKTLLPGVDLLYARHFSNLTCLSDSGLR